MQHQKISKIIASNLSAKNVSKISALFFIKIKETKLKKNRIAKFLARKSADNHGNKTLIGIALTRRNYGLKLSLIFRNTCDIRMKIKIILR